MKLSSEYLPARRPATPNIVLLHGWGWNREVWRPMIAHLRDWANITLVDIPGLAPEINVVEPLELASLTGSLVELCAPNSLVVGHSLGGNLALAMAQEAPDRVAGVVTLCTNPCFIASEGWPGMQAVEFRTFESGAATDVGAALRHFAGLQAQGADHPRNQIRRMRAQFPAEASTGIRHGLCWLKELDQRSVISQSPVPVRHYFGQSDALVPQKLADQLGGNLLSGSHLLPLEHPVDLAQKLREFVVDLGLQEPPDAGAVTVAKADIAASFSRAASTYDSVAVLQREVGEKLVSHLEGARADATLVLDLGCGTGYFAGELQRRFPQAHYLGLDIAPGMVSFAKGRAVSTCQWLVGDAEELPLASESVDVIFSSLAVQWCYRPRNLLGEIRRVLKPGGLCVFTSLGPQTLHELRASWAAVDAHQHVNDFLPVADLQAAAQSLQGLSLRLEVDTHTMKYGRLRELFTELKNIGAHNMNNTRQPGLTSRRSLQGMMAAYENFRVEGLLPATYEVIYGALIRQ